MADKKVCKKTFEHDGASYTIGRYSFGQMEQLHLTGDNKPITRTALALAALQNGEPDAGWTEEKIRDEFDPETFDHLFEDITAFNKIKWTRPIEAGEDQAADSISTKPAAE